MGRREGRRNEESLVYSAGIRMQFIAEMKIL